METLVAFPGKAVPKTASIAQLAAVGEEIVGPLPQRPGTNGAMMRLMAAFPRGGTYFLPEEMSRTCAAATRSCAVSSSLTGQMRFAWKSRLRWAEKQTNHFIRGTAAKNLGRGGGMVRDGQIGTETYEPPGRPARLTEHWLSVHDGRFAWRKRRCPGAGR